MLYISAKDRPVFSKIYLHHPVMIAGLRKERPRHSLGTEPDSTGDLRMMPKPTRFEADQNRIGMFPSQVVVQDADAVIPGPSSVSIPNVINVPHAMSRCERTQSE